jgi:hypothetical protein
MAPSLVAAHVLFVMLALWMAARAAIHALAGLISLSRGEDTLSPERLLVASVAGVLLAAAVVVIGVLGAAVALLLPSVR